MPTTGETQAPDPQITETQAEVGHSFGHVLTSFRSWWLTHIVDSVNQVEVIAKRREDCQLSSRYLFMLGMAAAIAILGLLLSSPAVVIGAMLLSPLMGPIIGLGFSFATGDYRWMRQSAKSLAIGTVLAIAFTALIVFMSPLQTVTPEIAARTRPNLFDLGIAFFSALAGAYAMIRGREGTVVGVAIATALMPPLAVVGFGLATWNGTVFWGALFLYVTNLITIALTAWMMAKFYGFRSSLSEKQTLLQSLAIVGVFIALIIPLFLSLNQIVWETRSTQKVRSEVLDAFVAKSVIANVDINFDAEPITISATVFTPQLNPEAEGIAARAIEREIDRDVDVTLIQTKVGEDEDAAEAAQLAAARASQEAAALRRAEELATRLALVAGVTEREVMVDREKRRATVAVNPLEGATLAAYRELEDRIIRTEPEWDVQLKPPARPMPDVTFDGDEPDDAGQDALDIIAWAGPRVAVPVILTGPEARVATVAKFLRNEGVDVRQKPTTNGEDGPVSARWGAPDE